MAEFGIISRRCEAYGFFIISFIVKQSQILPLFSEITIHLSVSVFLSQVPCFGAIYDGNSLRCHIARESEKIAFWQKKKTVI